MVVAILLESGVKVSEETLETIVDKAKIIHIMDQILSFFKKNSNQASSGYFNAKCRFSQTFADADFDNDGKINRDDWQAFVLRQPKLLKNMTLPHLKLSVCLFLHLTSNVVMSTTVLNIVNFVLILFYSKSFYYKIF